MCDCWTTLVRRHTLRRAQSTSQNEDTRDADTLDLGLIGNCPHQRARSTERAPIVWCCYAATSTATRSAARCSTDEQKARPRPFRRASSRIRGRSEQRYERNTAVLVTRASTTTPATRSKSPTSRRASACTAACSAPSMLVRIVRRIAGRPRIALRLRPAFDYGARARRATLRQPTTFAMSARRSRCA